MNDQPRLGGERLRRIMLALDALHCETSLLEAAATMAAKLDAELDALFVEDDDVRTVAALPFTREISLLSASEREISVPWAERTLRSLSREAEQRFVAVTRRSRVRGRFQVTRARREEALSDAAVRVDLLLLHPREHGFVRLRMIDDRPARVFVLCARTAASRRAMEIGARLAHDDHHLLELMVAGTLDAAARSELEAAGLTVRVHEFPARTDVQTMLAAIEDRSGNYILVPGDLFAAEERKLLLQRLTQLRAQVLLVN